MITLHQFSRAFGTPNPSPFCSKVETYLRLTGLEYEIEWVTDPSKAPKGKCPFIVDGDKTIPDSHFILSYLKETYGDPLGEGLSDLDRARHHAMTRMMENHLYFALLYSRWVLPGNSDIVREQFFDSVPALMRGVVFGMVQRGTRKALHGQGLGRHSQQEIERLAIEDIHTLSTILGHDPYFGGDRPREVDCVAFAFVSGALARPFVSPIIDTAESLPNLVAYNARMMESIYPDL